MQDSNTEKFLEYLVIVLLTLPPLWKILRRAGFSALCSLFALFPVVGTLVSICILAFAQWPAIQRTDH